MKSKNRKCSECGEEKELQFFKHVDRPGPDAYDPLHELCNDCYFTLYSLGDLFFAFNGIASNIITAQLTMEEVEFMLEALLKMDDGSAEKRYLFHSISMKLQDAVKRLEEKRG